MARPLGRESRSAGLINGRFLEEPCLYPGKKALDLWSSSTCHLSENLEALVYASNIKALAGEE